MPTGVASGDRHYESASYWKEYTSFASDIDLLTDSPGGADMSKGSPKPCRRIKIGSSGNIVLVRMDGTSITTTGVVAGDILDVQAQTIKNTSTITNCTVYW